jgi:GNAT superfamily N-acetyltransferase
MSRTSLEIRRTTESDWADVRALRLEMLADTPMAYGETLEAALLRDETWWRMRAARGSSSAQMQLVAIRRGEWLGTMGGYVPDAATGPVLVGVYVVPRARGARAGVTDALLAAVEDWAAERAGTLSLIVHEQNLRARAAYAKRGFVPTGHTIPYILNPAETELEMRKPVG